MTGQTVVEIAITEVTLCVILLSAGHSVAFAEHFVTVSTAIEYTVDVVKAVEEVALSGGDVTTTKEVPVPGKRTLPLEETGLRTGEVVSPEPATYTAVDVLFVGAPLRKADEVPAETPCVPDAEVLPGEGAAPPGVTTVCRELLC